MCSAKSSRDVCSNIRPYVYIRVYTHDMDRVYTCVALELCMDVLHSLLVSLEIICFICTVYDSYCTLLVCVWTEFL